MDNHPCCRDLVSSDLHLLGSLGKHLVCKLFAADADVKQAVTWLQTLDTSFFYTEVRINFSVLERLLSYFLKFFVCVPAVVTLIMRYFAFEVYLFMLPSE
jgi:hypothetical protein